ATKPFSGPTRSWQRTPACRPPYSCPPTATPRRSCKPAEPTRSTTRCSAPSRWQQSSSTHTSTAGANSSTSPQVSSMPCAARLLPQETAHDIRQITNGRRLATLDNDLSPIDDPQLPTVARALTPAAISQIIRIAHRTACDSGDVTAEVANCVTQDASPKGAA